MGKKSQKIWKSTTVTLSHTQSLFFWWDVSMHMSESLWRSENNAQLLIAYKKCREDCIWGALEKIYLRFHLRATINGKLTSVH